MSIFQIKRFLKRGTFLQINMKQIESKINGKQKYSKTFMRKLKNLNSFATKKQTINSCKYDFSQDDDDTDIEPQQ